MFASNKFLWSVTNKLSSTYKRSSFFYLGSNYGWFLPPTSSAAQSSTTHNRRQIENKPENQQHETNLNSPCDRYGPVSHIYTIYILNYYNRKFYI